MKALEAKILDLSAAFGLYDYWAHRHLAGIHVELVDLTVLEGGEAILDLGCGTGRLAARIKEEHPECQVKGIDPGHRMIKAARQRNGDFSVPEDFVVGSATDLPFEDHTFDCVFSCLVLHLLAKEETAQALHEIGRVLKPDGRYVSVEFESYPMHWLSSKQASYPKDLLPQSNLTLAKEIKGPSVTKRHHAVYRVLSPDTDASR